MLKVPLSRSSWGSKSANFPSSALLVELEAAGALPADEPHAASMAEAAIVAVANTSLGRLFILIPFFT
jgi:hypothetical protein